MIREEKERKENKKIIRVREREKENELRKGGNKKAN